MKRFFTTFCMFFCIFSFAQKQKNTIYQFKVKDIYGNNFDLSTLKGKKVMIVNTASKCGLTPQYQELEEIYQRYKDQNFVIIGFPANDFKEQEPESNEKIAEFCQKNYGVSFLMMEKISVVGKTMHPLYKFLTTKKLNGVENSQVQWNFQKYLIGKNGRLEKIISPKTSPKDKEIIDWIEQ